MMMLFAAFKEDHYAYKEALKEIRGQFLSHKSETNAETLQVLFAEGREAVDFIRMIVQGVQNQRGNFGTQSCTVG